MDALQHARLERHKKVEEDLPQRRRTGQENEKGFAPEGEFNAGRSPGRVDEAGPVGVIFTQRRLLTSDSRCWML
jgi:hypothetical protein